MAATSALVGTPQAVAQRTNPSLLQQAIALATEGLFQRQARDGHWVGELQGDTILESEYILLLAFLGREQDERALRAARYLLEQQMPEGGWNNYPGGPAELSTTVKAYFALKLVGFPATDPFMQSARKVIHDLGGAERCNTFTNFYLALLGQIPYRNCPAVPVEMILLPRWFYVNLYAMSSWTRTILVPLSICYAFKPVRELPADRGIRELFLSSPDEPRLPARPTRQWFSWTNFFLAMDRVLKVGERFHLTPLRSLALRRARQWMLERFADSDGLGAIFPPMIYTVISLRCLGYADSSPEMRWALKQLDDLMIREGESLRLQPCFSPVWDTALTLNALGDAGVSPEQPGVRKAVQWLLDKEVRRPGDWSLINPNLPPAGWFFEYRNGFYPDTDDTAMVLMALAKCRRSQGAEEQAAADRAVRWLLGMQNRDGGWAAFDRDIDRQLLEKVPFADHNAMLDPSCPDITARVLEALGYHGLHVGHPAVDRGIEFIEQHQDPRGCWLGRWGVNYLYGTWQVLQGLRQVGFSMQTPMVRSAVSWLEGVQQADGSWGESCRSYDDPSLAGQGTSTASQTAWALLGLIAAGEADSPTVRRGIQWLLDQQEPDGSWQEEPFTGTGFPKVFYLKYHMYRLYFPLMALARFARATGTSLDVVS